jgi:hypothetical protein
MWEVAEKLSHGVGNPCCAWEWVMHSVYDNDLYDIDVREIACFVFYNHLKAFVSFVLFYLHFSRNDGLRTP